MRSRRIRTKCDKKYALKVGGWLDGKRSYLWLGKEGKCLGIIGDGKLYRLAKAIVRHWEAGK